jgi:hypothetical protein
MRRAGIDPLTAEAVATAAAWRLIGLLLERPRGDWHEQVAVLAREVHTPTLRAAARAAADAREGAYLSLLGPGGAISPREIAYRGLHDPGQVLAAVAGFYGAFAYRPSSEDPIDHAAVEAGFVGYLRLKEAFALARGDVEGAGTSRDGAARFLEEHVRYWATPLAKRLARSDAPHLLLAAREAMRQAGPPPAPAGPWVPLEEEGPGVASDPFGCGGRCGGDQGAQEGPRRSE